MSSRRGFTSRRASAAARRRLVESIDRGEVRVARESFATFWARLLRERRRYLTAGSFVDFETHGRKRLLPVFADVPLARMDEDRVRLCSRRWPGELRLSRVPAVSIASIRGCVGGAGREFVRLCDLHFASRGHTTAGRIDVDRVIADDRLDDEVDQIASRIARLAPEVIARAKADRALPLV